MIYLRTIIIILVIAFSGSLTFAGRNITLPFEEHFDSGDTWTSDLKWVDCGAEGTHYNTDGWQGGHADFKPPPSACAGGGSNMNGGMSTFGRLEGFSAPQINIRFLLKIGSTYIDDLANGGGGLENKLIDVHGTAGRYGVLSLNCNPYGPYCALGTWTDLDVVRYTTDGRGWIEDAVFRIDEGNNKYTDEWISVEYEIIPATNSQTIYVHTLDGEFAGATATGTKTQSGNINYLDIGGYYNAYVPTVRQSNHLKFDDIKIDTQYIGPPEGFLEGNSIPQGGIATPKKVQIVVDSTPPPPPPTTWPPTEAGIIFYSNFEENNFSEWQGGNTSGLSITSNAPNNGNYCAKADLIEGHHGDVGYADYYFGDHYSIGGEKVEEVYLTLWSKFSSGYVWPSSDHKIALINLTDQSGARKYQIYTYVNSQGQYVVDHADIGDWRWTGYPQNVGTPVTVSGDNWDKLKLYVRLNTTGVSDGIIKFWVNNQLKASYSGIDLRENTSLGLNKLIMSTWADTASGSDGTQYWDDFTLSSQDPDLF